MFSESVSVRKIVLTGGGTAGHVMPHIALLPEFHKAGWEVHYVGSGGIEKRLMIEQGVPFYQIPAGKLRRYFSVRNLTDIFRIIAAVLSSLWILRRLSPDLVFSKGGFVSVPVSVAAWILRIPVLTHESDVTPGLANRMITPFARKIFCAFPETLKYLPSGKGILTGIPVRSSLREGLAKEGLRICNFTEEDSRPVVLIMGGSQGAESINQAVLQSQDLLLQEFRLIHLTGAGKDTPLVRDGYQSFEFAGEELPHLFAASELVVGRAGANFLFECLSLRKPMLLIPLQKGSRGDQLLNAASFSRAGWAQQLSEENLSPETLLEAIRQLHADAAKLRQSMEQGSSADPSSAIMELLHLHIRQL
ncbi:MAG: undecaprenyldiphospho-muramoylpentapeptide beta-N-acetylglucosaminyltransferase [Deltaproteobacteria bacterium]|nr:undecaprenyldiphospho-muramoylpentapeptide beta-N-acetylglucosaminyltransferase [Deltaproteobacteria bacterium]